MKKTSMLIIFCTIILISCSPFSISNQTTFDEKTSEQSDILKPDIEYSIINIDKGTSATPNKCIIDIRLSNLIQEEDINQIAKYVKEIEGAKCEPLFIYYFLENNQPGIDSAWAYSNFNPDLEVKINGMTVD